MGTLSIPLIDESTEQNLQAPHHGLAADRVMVSRDEDIKLLITPDDDSHSCLANIFILFLRLLGIFLVAVIVYPPIAQIIYRQPRPQFYVNSITTSATDVSVSQIIANLRIGFFIANDYDDNVTISYDGIDASFFYKNTLLGMAEIPAFDQPPQNKTSKEVVFSVAADKADYGIPKAIAQDIKPHQLVSFNMKIFGSGNFITGSGRLEPFRMSGSCEGLDLRFPSSIAPNMVWTWEWNRLQKFVTHYVRCKGD